MYLRHGNVCVYVCEYACTYDTANVPEAIQHLEEILWRLVKVVHVG